jgi:hypothetical protein
VARGRHDCVYFIDAPAEKLVKIGYSYSARDRLKSLQAVSPSPLLLMAYYRVPDARMCEQAIHSALVDHRMHGEWFNMKPDEAIDAALPIAQGFCKKGEPEFIDLRTSPLTEFKTSHFALLELEKRRKKEEPFILDEKPKSDAVAAIEADKAAGRYILRDTHLAEILDVPAKQVRAAMRSGTLPSKMMSSRIFFCTHDDAIVFVEAQSLLRD